MGIGAVYVFLALTELVLYRLLLLIVPGVNSGVWQEGKGFATVRVWRKASLKT